MSDETFRAKDAKAPRVMAPPLERPRVLSVQSLCVRSVVGQKAAALPLNALGFEVDPINTVYLSNHLGYANGAAGKATTADELAAMVDGLKRNGLLGAYTHVLSGYVGSTALLDGLVRLLDDLPRDAVYVCDPVLGDHGKFYVPEELVAVYRERVLPRATMATPNQFEAEKLTGLKIESLRDALRACDAMHDDLGVRVVVISSCVFEACPAGEAALVASIRSAASREDGSGGARRRRFTVRIPLVEGRFSGAGDLFAALVLGRVMAAEPAPLEESVPRALELACAAAHAVVRRTREAHVRGRNPLCELAVVECVAELLAPVVDPRMRVAELEQE